VRFAFLHPATDAQPSRRNDMSCVLRIATSSGSMLFTGDIERAAESALLFDSAGLKSDVMLAPHHGSRTSSSEAFIAAVAPRWAIVAAGYRNRFGHPSAEVLERYRAAGADVWRTDMHGAVHAVFSAEEVSVTAERMMRRRYWLQ
jgi:competence protein ComEC